MYQLCILYESLEWGTTWYLSSTGDTITREDRKNGNEHLLPRNRECKDAEKLNGINNKLCNELRHRLKLTPEKVELIREGFLKLPNNKVCKNDAICISKTKLSCAESMGELCGTVYGNKLSHKKRECSCYCWHTMCNYTETT